MEVNDALIEKLGRLAQLRFDSGEKEQIRKDLQRMIGFIEKLQELDTTGVEPLLHMSAGTDRLRDDLVNGSCSREEALRNAPQADNQYFRVPKVIRK